VSAPDAEALHIAVKALARRELSTFELAARLRRAGICPDTSTTVIDHLREAGYLSDTRAAQERARVLAARPLGDTAIAADLARRGIPDVEIEEAIGTLGSETDRAEVLARRARDTRALQRMLRTRGFSSDTIERLLGSAVADESQTEVP
jgi:regulatory protein